MCVMCVMYVCTCVGVEYESMGCVCVVCVVSMWYVYAYCVVCGRVNVWCVEGRYVDMTYEIYMCYGMWKVCAMSLCVCSMCMCLKSEVCVLCVVCMEEWEECVCYVYVCM